MLRLHFFAGVLVAPFILIAAITGLLYVLTPQLEEAIYGQQLHVPATEDQVPLSTQVNVARNALPEAELKAVRPAATSTDTTQVIFTALELPESYFRTVFVDPHDAEIRGVLDTYGSNQALPLRAWASELHRGLHLGDLGRVYSELAASWLWVVVLGGVALWFGRRRVTRKLRMRPPGRTRVLSWHGVTGAGIGVGLLFLSATGLTWSTFTGGNIGKVRETLSWETPAVAKGLPMRVSCEQSDRRIDIGYDQVRQVATHHGLTGQVEITPPEHIGAAYTVQETGRSWPTQQDSVAIHPVTGQITDSVRFADYPLMAKLSRWGVDAHMGLLFGWPNQVVLAALMIAAICVIIWGYRMWWLRRPTRGFGHPPSRGAWRRLPIPLLLGGVLVTIGVGCAVPLLGISLLAFLCVDALLGMRGTVASEDSARRPSG
ncbi:PepSY-associated TM helix domain-containing protein [Saccharopolyspora mangrovi]|uniref:PepSY-associated TM helix domain-containing protein n=1 Tax=Saccharopolyspora mangrovi TaxID=3082379 RepID=A0ABU6AEZ5_9PSEU|nr:PepSY-associated TM helix domain-containing protein [Saccharopolyspora sp. S2-29]MEB3370116.1 PepSY-associated TM helix domain-containing protein [Saccharopolyspora sp. S2-29]